MYKQRGRGRPRKEKKRYSLTNQPNTPRTDHTMADYVTPETKTDTDTPDPTSKIITYDSPRPMYLELLKKIQDLEARVKELETDKELSRSSRRDTLGDRILTFLKQYPGIRFNTGTVAANINHPSDKVSNQLRLMANSGVLDSEKLEGHSAMFWYNGSTKEVD